MRTNVPHVHTQLTTNLLFRSFLLFIPAPKANLRAVLSYYSATATVNQEGDVHINDSMQGLGTAPVPIHTLISIMASRPCPEIFHESLATAMLSRLFSQTPLSRDWNLLLHKSDTKVSLPTDVDPKLPPANPYTNMSKRKPFADQVIESTRLLPRRSVRRNRFENSDGSSGSSESILDRTDK